MCFLVMLGGKPHQFSAYADSVWAQAESLANSVKAQVQVVEFNQAGAVVETSTVKPDVRSSKRRGA
jgi:hypothetical protein